jgi:RNA polymerase sigma-70 factor, ECF subfamily
MDDDATLVRLARTGGPDAFAPLVARHAPALLAWIGHGLGLDAHTCDDVAQETFLAAWRHLRTWDAARGSFRGWLFAIARNRARNLARRRRPRLLADPPEAAAASGGSIEPEAFRRLDAALADLPEAQRAAFLLAHVHGLPLAEVARLEDVPEGTVKSRVARARARLREVLERKEGARHG